MASHVKLLKHHLHFQIVGYIDVLALTSSLDQYLPITAVLRKVLGIQLISIKTGLPSLHEAAITMSSNRVQWGYPVTSYVQLVSNGYVQSWSAGQKRRRLLATRPGPARLGSARLGYGQLACRP